MKNRKREICTSGSVRDEAGQPPHLLGHRWQFLHLATGIAQGPSPSGEAQAQVQSVSWKVRNAAVMVRGGLERATEGNRRLVAERPADQLQSDRHAVPRLSGRNFEHREPEIVDRSHEARDCLDGGLNFGRHYRESGNPS